MTADADRTPRPIPSRIGDTAAQLHDLPDLATHLALRATTSAPGSERGRSHGDPAEHSPVNLAVVHALDSRRHGRGDAVLEWLEDDQVAYRCSHPNHKPHECPVEPDDDGTIGLLPSLCQWADMIAADLDGWEPGADSQPPTENPYLAPVCGWIARHLTAWEAVNPDAAPLLRAGVQRWHAKLRSELGETDPVPLRHANLGGCGGRLLPLADGIRHECVDCHEVLTPGEMLGLARWQADVTLGEAADALGVKHSRLRKWKERTPDDFPRPVNPNDWPPLYPLREIRDMVKRRGA